MVKKTLIKLNKKNKTKNHNILILKVSLKKGNIKSNVLFFLITFSPYLEALKDSSVIYHESSFTTTELLYISTSTTTLFNTIMTSVPTFNKLYFIHVNMK